MTLPGSLTWQRLVFGSLAFGVAISALPMGMRAYVMGSWWALVDYGALMLVSVFTLGAAVFQLVGGAAETRAWLRHWIFGVVVAYFSMAAVLIGITGYADFANEAVKWRLWAIAVPLGALNILIMRAWLAREKTGSNR